MNAQNDLFNTKQHGEFILMLNAECTTRNHESFQVSYFFFFLESKWMKQWHFWIVFVSSSLHCFLLHTFQICNFVNVVMSFKTFLWVVCIEPMKLTCDPVVLLCFFFGNDGEKDAWYIYISSPLPVIKVQNDWLL